MDAIFDHYPVFEANQVLTSGHLNDGFDFLEQQERLTRSRLVGIGIACGLDIRLDTSGAPAIFLSKGCGVTSEGYLALQEADVTLTSYRSYTLPTDVDYPTFKDSTKVQYPLWELLPDGEPNTTLLGSPAGFLDDKAVLFFVELKQQALRNCSPTNCDDKGSDVEVTLRPLLIATADLDRIIAAAGALGTDLTPSDLDAALNARLALPDIRVGRFDVTRAGLVTSADVYMAFGQVFRAQKLAHALGDALTAAYTAFKPLLEAQYPANPFAGFVGSFGFLDVAPELPAQVRFLQYYLDFFEDLVRAYDEFRWKGVDLVCACCPDDALFPRHLMLGLLHPEAATDPGRYRQPFLPSPAVSSCGAETQELLQLFARLVEMITSFTNTPSLPPVSASPRFDPQVRVTPSVLGDRPLAVRAIPYYYKEDGTPPLYQLWNGELTRRRRANENLSFRSDEYKLPVPPFVTEPLRFDLERYNFLRIEGHLGKDYLQVLTTLLQLRANYRLPIDVVAVRASVYDDSQTVDPRAFAARFQDLDALYEALRLELLSSLAEGMRELYEIPAATPNNLAGGAPALPLLAQLRPDYRYPANSIGAGYEKHLQRFEGTPYIDVDQKLVSDPAFANEVLKVYCGLFLGVSDQPAENQPHAVAIYYLSRLAEVLPPTLDVLSFDDFRNRYQDLLALASYFRADAIAQVAPDLQRFVPQQELIDDLTELLSSCKLESIGAVNDEYARRVGVLKKAQFLSSFLQQHPGVQHKAGVTPGGTFIVVYHQNPTPKLEAGVNAVAVTAAFASASAVSRRAATPIARGSAVPSSLSSSVSPSVSPSSAVDVGQAVEALARGDVQTLALADAITRIGSNRELASNPDIGLLLGSLTGQIPLVSRPGGSQAVNAVTATVDGLADGTVIADFFLPYRLANDGPGMEFVLPKSPPSFTAEPGCTGTNGTASVTVTVKGGVAPYELAVDQQAYAALDQTVVLAAGSHTLVVRDDEGTESAPRTLVIPPSIVIGTPNFMCGDAGFTATFSITGGTAPYKVNGKDVQGATFTTDPAPSPSTVPISVVDSVGCSVTTSFTYECPPPCTLPCGGMALNRNYLWWLPDPDPNNLYGNFDLTTVVLTVDVATGQPPIDLSAQLRPIFKAQAADLTVEGFPALMKLWFDQINKMIAGQPGLSQGNARWLTLAYAPSGPGRFGVLSVEHFQCLGFTLQIEGVLTRRKGANKISFRITPDGTTLLVDDTKAVVPAFDGFTVGKCVDGSPNQPLCMGSLSVLQINLNDVGNQLYQLSVQGQAGMTYFWEVQGDRPTLSGQPSFNMTIPSGGTIFVTVAGFTQQGCRAIASRQLSVP